MRKALLGLGITTVLLLSACGQQGLRTVYKPGEGPDEFMVIPVKPLSPPKDYAALPAPTPGGANLTDRNPQEEAIVALGGRVSTSGTVPGSDAALVNHVSRYGVPENARAVVVAENEAYLARQTRWQGWRLVDRYDEIYKDQWLNALAEAERFRRAGVSVSSGPPFGL